MSAFTLALLLTVPSAVAPRHVANVGDRLQERRDAWSAEDAAPLAPLEADAADPGSESAASVRRGVPVRAPASRAEGAAGAANKASDGSTAAQANVATDADGNVAADVAERELRQAAAEALNEVARAKLAQAEVVAAHAADPETKRIPLVDYQLLLQRASCAAAHGRLDCGPGAACMARPLVGRTDDGEDSEEAKLCAKQGGVLVSRMARCTEASVALAGLDSEEGASVGLETLVGTFAEVARHCWGQVLCVD